jgi:tetratricopeptide (TPR) repeat protein
VLEKLLAEGRPAYRTLARLLANEEESLRHELWVSLDKHVSRLIPGLCEPGKEIELDEFLEMRLSSGDAARADYAVFLLQSGRLPAAAERWQAILDQYGDPRAASVLTFLYRAQGDLTRALWAAQRTEDLTLVHLIRHEQGDWKELSTNYQKYPELQHNLGLRAAYHHLAGDEERLGPLLASLPVGVLLQLARTDRALGQKDGEPIIPHLDLLAERMEYGRLFRILERVKPGDASLNLYRARRLGDVGEQTLAETILQRLQQTMEKKATGGQQSSEVKKAGRDLGEASAWTLEPLQVLEVKKLLRPRAEILPEYARILEDILRRADAKAEARTEMKALSAVSGPEVQLLAVMSALYPSSSWEGLGWSRVFRHLEPKESVLETLQRVDRLIAGKMSRAEVDRAFAAVHTLAEDANAGHFFAPMARRAEALGRADLAQQCLELATRGGEASAWQALGDAFLQAKQFAKAADSYRRARERDPADAASCFLQGFALTQWGQEQDGKRLMQVAYRLPLADAGRRRELVQALERVGLTEEAQGQRELIAHNSLRDWSTGQNFRELSREAAQRQNHQQAAAAYERFVLNALWRQSFFLENEASLWVGAHLHLLRARARYEAKDVDGLVRELRRALDLYPGDTESLLRYYHDLHRRGRGKDADDLYARCFRLHETLCLEFPYHAAGHNQLAWLAARCRRDLDNALTHARQAVNLRPAEVGYHDTLAEVCFQRGDRERALAENEQCLRLAPQNTYYRRQRERITAGDPRAPLPE